MASTIRELMAAAGLTPQGVVPWRTAVPCRSPGVYLVALDRSEDRLDAVESIPPVGPEAVTELLDRRPELTLDGARPTPKELAQRLGPFWLPDETVLYIGKAGTSLADRVNAYYTTPLGARRPHAGGWPLKTLTKEIQLWVHWAECDHPESAEDTMLGHFCRGVSAVTQANLRDPAHPFPFANLEWPPGNPQGPRNPRSTPAHSQVAALFLGTPTAWTAT